jgi:hypothetical protein
MLISGAEFRCSPCGARAKQALKWHADNGPADMQPLPLGYSEREALKDGTPRHILAWYARSLAEQKYNVQKHPSFHEYACGVMASPVIPACMQNNEELRRRFPPQSLEGLDSHLYWTPPKRQRAA